MKYQKKLGIWLLLIIMILSGCQKQEKQKDPVQAAYLDAAVWESGFLAAGTEGRLARIGTDSSVKKLESNTDCKLLSVAANDDTAVAVGEGGAALLISADDKVSALSPKTETTLYSVCFFGNDCFVGTEEGTLLKTADFQMWERIQLPLEGTVTGLAANDERCVLVTDKGETAATTDGGSWTVLDYNEYYGQEVSFKGIECCELSFLAYGVDADGIGRALETIEGGVWSERSLQTEEEAQEGIIPEGVTAVCWDGQQAYASRTDGQVLTMPSCVSCNKLQQVGEKPLFAAAYSEGQLLFAGQDYQVYVLETESVRQSRIKAPAALEKQQNGALVIDVRSKEDYDARHIRGAVHMEPDQVAKELPSLCEDRECEIIFYCQTGKRSQEALETAQALGYLNVYNLGGIDDWQYEFSGI